MATALTAMGGMALAAVDRRHLRVAVVHGDAPHARDRHSHRARAPKRWQVLRSIAGGAADVTSRLAACSAPCWASLFAQMRSVILISIPGAGRLDAADDLS